MQSTTPEIPTDRAHELCGLPHSPGAYQTTNGSGNDAFVTKFDSGRNLVYSTYLGGNGTDYGYDIAVDDTGNVYITGNTPSDNFPTTAGAYQTANAGDLR